MSVLLLKLLRRIYGVIHPATAPPIRVHYAGQAASDYIQQILETPGPCMICRFGNVELNATLRAYHIRRHAQYWGEKSWNYIRGQIHHFWWDQSAQESMWMDAGFFPATPTYLERFGERMIADMQLIDVLAFWEGKQDYFVRQIQHFLTQAKLIRFSDLEPYYHEHPWSKALQGKTVLVIHPFVDTIQKQYQKREMLFQNPDILPEFELKTLRAVQSIAGNDCGFPDWFAAFDWMCEAISKIEFDIAIIGAGAYGLPLAAHVKRLGKKAIHLGGPTQILFGIKGGRWDEMPFFQQLYNEHWVRPAPHEVPPKIGRVKAYW
ncbi:MAG: hypothetical protein RMI89_08830 [Gloeomargarita sp. SKYBB_i_bin120]|nr:hypothetical protein [Gloeomargarita sp. SKYB120]MDW8178622.1 hypothetical protein [Gloeomargarita sp. SKYBB_i_bin120]